MLAAGLGSIGEIVVLDSRSLTRQFSIRTSSINSFDDFIFIDENFDGSSAKSDLPQPESHHALLVLARNSLIRFKVQ